MAQVKTYSLRNEDTRLHEWLIEQAKVTPGGESGLVRVALYHLMGEQDERDGLLKGLSAGQERIEAKQDQILEWLAILREGYN